RERRQAPVPVKWRARNTNPAVVSTRGVTTSKWVFKSSNSRARPKRMAAITANMWTSGGLIRPVDLPELVNVQPNMAREHRHQPVSPAAVITIAVHLAGRRAPVTGGWAEAPLNLWASWH